MIQEFRKRLGVKLFVLLTALIILAMAPFSYVVFSTVSQFGNSTANVNREEIKSRAYSYLASIAREKAHKYDAFFSHVETASSLMAAQTREVYDHLTYYAGFPDARLEMSAQDESGMHVGSRNQMVHTAFAREMSVSAQERLEMQALLRLDPVFKAMQREIPESVGINLVTATGICRYLGRINDGTGQTDSDGPERADCRQSGAAVPSTGKYGPLSRHTMWTQVHREQVTGSLHITARSPVVDSRGVLRATISIDIPFADHMGRLEKGAGTNENWVDQILFSFLLDENGRIITFPRKYLRLFGLSAETEGPDGTGGDILDLRLGDSTIAGVRAIAANILDPVAETVEVRLDDSGYILNMHTLHRLNWHLVLVTKESQLTSSVARTQQALSGTLTLLAQKFAINVVLIVLAMLVAVFFAVGYFVAPLKRLSETALQVGQGDLQVRCELNRADELGILATSFNDMISKLAAAGREQQNHARKLEQTVQERTMDLRRKNLALSEVIGELNAESERRRQAVEALKKSEQQIRIVMEADISDRKQAEAELLKSKLLLQESLAEKEVLLREIYHRTKNNMLVIISLLHLQALEIDDERVKTLFWETENRIRAMSLVHEKLYQSQNLAEIDLGQYLEEMVAALVRSMVIGDHVRIEMDCEHVPVSIDNILPLGLAINEIVTNSLKHAFPDGRAGRIFVRLNQDEYGLVEVVVGDDGPGLPPDMEPGRVRSLGMQITVNLIKKQLHGSMDVSSDGGVVYRIRFAEAVRPKRV